MSEQPRAFSEKLTRRKGKGLDRAKTRAAFLSSSILQRTIAEWNVGGLAYSMGTGLSSKYYTLDSQLKAFLFGENPMYRFPRKGLLGSKLVAGKRVFNLRSIRAWTTGVLGRPGGLITRTTRVLPKSGAPDTARRVGGAGEGGYSAARRRYYTRAGRGRSSYGTKYRSAYARYYRRRTSTYRRQIRIYNQRIWRMPTNWLQRKRRGLETLDLTRTWGYVEQEELTPGRLYLPRDEFARPYSLRGDSYSGRTRYEGFVGEIPEYIQQMPRSLQAIVSPEAYGRGPTPYTPDWALDIREYQYFGWAMPSLAPSYVLGLATIAYRAGYIPTDVMPQPEAGYGLFTYTGRATEAQGRAEQYQQYALGATSEGQKDYFSAQANLWQARQAYWEFQQEWAPAAIGWGATRLASYRMGGNWWYARAFGWPVYGAVQRMAAGAMMSPFIQQALGEDPTFTQYALENYAMFSPGQYRSLEEQFWSGGVEWTGLQMGLWGMRAQISGERGGFVGTLKSTAGVGLLQFGMGITADILSTMTVRAMWGQEIVPQDEVTNVAAQLGVGIGFMAAGGYLWQRAISEARTQRGFGGVGVTYQPEFGGYRIFRGEPSAIPIVDKTVIRFMADRPSEVGMRLGPNQYEWPIRTQWGEVRGWSVKERLPRWRVGAFEGGPGGEFVPRVGEPYIPRIPEVPEIGAARVPTFRDWVWWATPDEFTLDLSLQARYAARTRVAGAEWGVEDFARGLEMKPQVTDLRYVERGITMPRSEDWYRIFAEPVGGYKPLTWEVYTKGGISVESFMTRMPEGELTRLKYGPEIEKALKGMDIEALDRMGYVNYRYDVTTDRIIPELKLPARDLRLDMERTFQRGQTQFDSLVQRIYAENYEAAVRRPAGTEISTTWEVMARGPTERGRPSGITWEVEGITPAYYGQETPEIRMRGTAERISGAKFLGGLITALVWFELQTKLFEPAFEKYMDLYAIGWSNFDKEQTKGAVSVALTLGGFPAWYAGEKLGPAAVKLAERGLQKIAPSLVSRLGFLGPIATVVGELGGPLLFAQMLGDIRLAAIDPLLLMAGEKAYRTPQLRGLLDILADYRGAPTTPYALALGYLEKQGDWGPVGNVLKDIIAKPYLAAIEMGQDPIGWIAREFAAQGRQRYEAGLIGAYAETYGKSSDWYLKYYGDVQAQRWMGRVYDDPRYDTASRAQAARWFGMGLTSEPLETTTTWERTVRAGPRSAGETTVLTYTREMTLEEYAARTQERALSGLPTSESRQLEVINARISQRWMELGISGGPLLSMADFASAQRLLAQRPGGWGFSGNTWAEMRYMEGNVFGVYIGGQRIDMAGGGIDISLLNLLDPELTVTKKWPSQPEYKQTQMSAFLSEIRQNIFELIRFPSDMYQKWVENIPWQQMQAEVDKAYKEGKISESEYYAATNVLTTPYQSALNWGLYVTSGEWGVPSELNKFMGLLPWFKVEEIPYYGYRGAKLTPLKPMGEIPPGAAIRYLQYLSTQPPVIPTFIDEYSRFQLPAEPGGVGYTSLSFMKEQLELQLKNNVITRLQYEGRMAELKTKFDRPYYRLMEEFGPEIWRQATTLEEPYLTSEDLAAIVFSGTRYIKGIAEELGISYMGAAGVSNERFRQGIADIATSLGITFNEAYKKMQKEHPELFSGGGVQRRTIRESAGSYLQRKYGEEDWLALTSQQRIERVTEQVEYWRESAARTKEYRTDVKADLLSELQDLFNEGKIDRGTLERLKELLGRSMARFWRGPEGAVGPREFKWPSALERWLGDALPEWAPAQTYYTSGVVGKATVQDEYEGRWVWDTETGKTEFVPTRPKTEYFGPTHIWDEEEYWTKWREWYGLYQAKQIPTDQYGGPPIWKTGTWSQYPSYERTVYNIETGKAERVSPFAASGAFADVVAWWAKQYGISEQEAAKVIHMFRPYDDYRGWKEKHPISKPQPSGVWQKGSTSIKAQVGFEGMVTEPTQFTAGEAGSEHVTVIPTLAMTSPLHQYKPMETPASDAKSDPEMARREMKRREFLGQIRPKGEKAAEDMPHLWPWILAAFKTVAAPVVSQQMVTIMQERSV